MTDFTSVVARVSAALDAIDAAEARLSAFVSIDRAGALARAAALDALPAERRGALHGVPYAVKEIIDRAGRPAAWGSALKADRVAETDAAVIERLDAAGAVALGETVSTEYAMAANGPTRNPHDPDLTPGGSSSGSAAAVGAGLLPFALASQTLGSIIRPAAYCGVVGYKPARGAIDRRGVMPLSERLDTIGVIAEDVPMARRAVEAMAEPLPAVAPQRVVAIEPWFAQPILHDAVWEATAWAMEETARLGYETDDARLPGFATWEEASATETILGFDMARHHEQDYVGGADRMSPTLQALMAGGLTVSPEAYDRACAMADRITEATAALFGPGDVLIAPATIGFPPAFGLDTGPREPQRYWTLIGWPSISVPVFWRGGLPIAVQVIARPGEDAAALTIAEALHRRKPI